MSLNPARVPQEKLTGADILGGNRQEPAAEEHVQTAPFTPYHP